MMMIMHDDDNGGGGGGGGGVWCCVEVLNRPHPHTLKRRNCLCELE